MMHMYFWWTENVGDFIFPGYKITTTVGLTATCFLLATLAFLFEWLKILEGTIVQRQLLRDKRDILKLKKSTENEELIQENIGRQQNVLPPIRLSKIDRAKDLGIKILLWFSTRNLGYFLMLAVMLFNGWMFISVLLGGAISYFVFGQTSVKLSLENYQILRDTFCIKEGDEPVPCICSEGIINANVHAAGESTPPIENLSEEQCHTRDVKACVH